MQSMYCIVVCSMFLDVDYNDDEFPVRRLGYLWNKCRQNDAVVTGLLKKLPLLLLFIITVWEFLSNDSMVFSESYIVPTLKYIEKIRSFKGKNNKQNILQK